MFSHTFKLFVTRSNFLKRLSSNLSTNRVSFIMSGKWNFSYPDVRRDTVVTSQWGYEVSDPYRWLEDSNSKETQDFVAKQNNISRPYIDACPVRKKIYNRAKDLLNYERFGCPVKHGNNYFMNINSGLQNQSVMYIMKGHLAAKPEVFFDPNTLSDDGTVALAQYKFSFDGKYFAYALSKSGSDWISIKIRPVDGDEVFSEELTRVKFSSISWTMDNKGFFYSAYPLVGDGTETDQCLNQKLYYHRLSTSQSSDILVHDSPEHSSYIFKSHVTECGHYLILFTIQSCTYNLVHYHKFEDPKNPKIDGKLEFLPVVTEFNSDYNYVGNDGPVHYFRTNRNASNFRLVKIDLTDQTTCVESKWADLIVEDEKNVLESVSMARSNLFICEYVIDVSAHIRIHGIDGSFIKEIPLSLGSVSAIFARRKENEIFYTFTSFLTPGQVYFLELDQELSRNPVLFKESKLPSFDVTDFVVEQIFYDSKDGTKIPMFLVHKKDLVRDGNAPCLLYGYGGFNISLLPYFSPARIILMQNMNGVFALANIRGGCEYGQKWHDGGRLKNKQNCFDDFIAAAEYLQKNQYTNSSKLAIQGGSNGGLLVATVSNQRPDLIGATIAQVGVLDMLRFHKFTIGAAWVSDYGNPDVEEDFINLVKYSPYHNVPSSDKVDKYPAILFLTADHDDRVVPLHSYKLVAELQHKLGSKFKQTPLLLHVDVKAGHGSGKPISKMTEEMTDIYSFIINALGIEFYE